MEDLGRKSFMCRRRGTPSPVIRRTPRISHSPYFPFPFISTPCPEEGVLLEGLGSVNGALFSSTFPKGVTEELKGWII